MNFVGSGQCKPVEYVNIRGHVAGGAGATAKFWQASNTWLIHIDSGATGCTFAPVVGAVSSEDNFNLVSTTKSTTDSDVPQEPRRLPNGGLADTCLISESMAMFNLVIS